MLARLGNVLYWLASGIAWLIIGGTAAFFLLAERLPSYQEQWVIAGIAAVCAFLVWLFGRALRYIFAGN